MKILIADKFHASGLEELKTNGVQVFFEPTLKDGALVDAMNQRQPDILVVRSTKVRAEHIDVSSQLKLIIRAGAGYDTIDSGRASSAGIFVANCPGKNAIAVAELTWAHILNCDRLVSEQTIELRQGQWNKKRYSKANGLYGKTLGVLGYGTIAKEVIARALAFGMKVVVWSRSLTPEIAAHDGLLYASTPIHVAEVSDIVSVHVASTPQTKSLINKNFVDAMGMGTYLINTSRGAVLDEDAVSKGIAEKGIRVGLDVYANEPTSGTADFHCELISAQGSSGSHHIGASTDQAQFAIAEEVVKIIRAFCEDGLVPNCVNKASSSNAHTLLTVRHRNRPGVLANVFRIISESKINVEEMENILYQGAEAACARIQVDGAITTDIMSSIRSCCEDILSVEETLIQN